MTPSLIPRLALAGCCAIVAALVGGCGSLPVAGRDGNYVQPVGAALVTPNPTPYTPMLLCLADYAERNRLTAPRVAVSRISDMTGKLDDNGGRTVTQGAMLMTISALGKAGIPVVERYETEVPRLEYNLSNNKLIARGDGRTSQREYRPIYPGQVSGADLFIAGGLTELNTNIRSAVFDLSGEVPGSSNRVGLAGGNMFIVNIALDMRLIDINSLDVIDMVSYQKQVIGREVTAGLFSFFGDNLISVSAGASGQEPVHLAVRSLVERAVLEMVSGIYGTASRQECLRAEGDYFAGPVVQPSSRSLGLAPANSAGLKPGARP